MLSTSHHVLYVRVASERLGFHLLSEVFIFFPTNESRSYTRYLYIRDRAFYMISAYLRVADCSQSGITPCIALVGFICLNKEWKMLFVWYSETQSLQRKCTATKTFSPQTLSIVEDSPHLFQECLSRALSSNIRVVRRSAMALSEP